MRKQTPRFNKEPGLLKLTAKKQTVTHSDLSLQPLLSRLMSSQSFRQSEAEKFLEALLDPGTTDAQIGAALVALAIKGETADELAGLGRAMRAHDVKLQCRHERFIDTAGTGSSKAKTFNVSTAAAFVIAGAGLPVAKHGGKAATSMTGSADVLTALGVQVGAPPEVSERCLNEIGICFMFAPLYHPAAARVAGIRRELGVHTTFNLLGPLTNPAGAPNQIIGVWNESLLEPMTRALAALGTKRSWIVHGSDGLDEITIAGHTNVVEASNDGIKRFHLEPEDFGLKRGSLDSVRAGDADLSARIVRDVLEGRRRDEARDLVIINASAGLLLSGVARNPNEARARAENSIDEGAALDKLQKLIRATTA